MKLVLVSGTGTEIGKTWWTVATARALVDAGVQVAARKPAQSYAPDEAGCTDAELLAQATGEPVHAVCPAHRWYEVPMAPPMAAVELGRPPFTLADLVRELEPDHDAAVMFVEGAGGPRSPLADDGDLVDLQALLRPDLVLLVADAGLGTINAVRTSAAALGNAPVVVALNRYDDEQTLHRANREWLERYGFDLVLEPGDLAQKLAANQ
jgi:dethiobiotin synthetase